jgi:hypothetical protein
VQVGLERRDAGVKACAVDLQVLHDTLDVVARFGERDAFDPVDGAAELAALLKEYRGSYIMAFAGYNAYLIGWLVTFLISSM